MASGDVSPKLVASYGKQSVPVFKIRKAGPRHSIVDMVVRIMLEGDVAKSWESGDNCQILPTETQKNTCYSIALKTEFTSPEDYALALGRDVLRRHGNVFNKVTLDVEERVWERIAVDNTPHNHAFMTSSAPIRRTAHVVVPRNGSVQVTSGIRDIKIMKTTQSEFMGYIVDEYTNLKPVGSGGALPDRIMCTDMVAHWTFASGSVPEGKFVETNAGILKTLLETYAGNPQTGVLSKSLQQTAHNMASEVLAKFSDVESVLLETPNVHFYPYPLEQFGLSNPNVVFQSTESQSTASGRIVTHLTRSSTKAKL